MTCADTAAIALMLGMSVNAVRILAHRHPEILPRRGRDHRGRTLYAIEDAENILNARLATA
ncbi:hypothetical protein [Actinomadura sp. HBU206391]|uniref:hypothetical protein n=1 Tax=Actinomadura sp. HBU206391 TaxID=2731692 RepID=UPI001650278D|nr:hypothetical protein [Actinomadura sp. HBU206391]MBC6458406.1 hypothetical protein [Actinomadura sp. HBU206391]